MACKTKYILMGVKSSKIYCLGSLVSLRCIVAVEFLVFLRLLKTVWAKMVGSK